MPAIPQREFGDAAPLAEVDPLPAGLERGLWPLVLPAGEREVVVLMAAARPWPCSSASCERPPQVIEPLALAQVGAGDAARAERPSRLGQAELSGERERPLGGGDRLRVGAREVA